MGVRAILLVLVALVAARPADADIRTAPPSVGPVLAGDRVAWIIQRGGHYQVLDAAAGGGDSPRLLTSATAEAFSGVPEIEGSPTRLAVELRHRVLTGLPAGALGVLEDCRTPGTPQGDIDLSGDLLIAADCSFDTVIHDLAAGSSEKLDGSRIHAHIAGDWVAWLEGDVPMDLVVVNRRTGAGYRVPDLAREATIARFDLQDDGKAVVAAQVEGSYFSHVGWASPEEPYLHRLPLPRAGYDVRIAGDRIAFLRGRHERNLTLALAEVGVSDLRGRVHVLAHDAEGDLFDERLGFDGERVAWAVLGCRDATIAVRPRTAPAEPAKVRHGCRLRFSRRAQRSSPGHVRVFVDCTGFAGGACRVRRLRLSFRGRLVAQVRGDDRAWRSVYGRQRATLTPFGRRLLDRRRRVRLAARAVLTDVAGRREARRGTVGVDR
jgi:hypothetical protein